MQSMQIYWRYFACVCVPLKCDNKRSSAVICSVLLLLRLLLLLPIVPCRLCFDALIQNEVIEEEYTNVTWTVCGVVLYWWRIVLALSRSICHLPYLRAFIHFFPVGLLVFSFSLFSFIITMVYIVYNIYTDILFVVSSWCSCSDTARARLPPPLSVSLFSFE